MSRPTAEPRLGPLPGRPPALPGGLRIYAIGDVHGRFDLLETLAAAIRRDLAAGRPARTMEIFLGDYVDRGPDSPGVIERLNKLGGSIPGKQERNPAAFEAYVKAEVARWAPILKASKAAK